MKPKTRATRRSQDALVRRICFVDDDPDNRRQWLEWAGNRGLSATAFESAYDANSVLADVFVFDVSAVSPMNVGHHAYAPIARLMQDHPGSEIIVGSCMSRNAVEEVLDEVAAACGRRPRFFDASYGFAGLERVMDELSSPNGEMSDRPGHNTDSATEKINGKA